MTMKKFFKLNYEPAFRYFGGTLVDEEALYDFSRYDGCDFFGVKGTMFVFLSQLLKELIEKAKLKNVQFDPIVPYKIRDVRRRK